MLFGAKDIIGLDIGSKHIKVVQLKVGQGSHRLERLGIATLQPELIVDETLSRCADYGAMRVSRGQLPFPDLPRFG